MIVYLSRSLTVSKMGRYKNPDRMFLSGFLYVVFKNYTVYFTFDFFWNVHLKDSFRPWYPHRPVGVRVNFGIISIEPISGELMNFKVGMFLKMRWNDHRLKFPFQRNRPRILTVPSDLSTELWIPDVFISNEER